MPVTTLLSPCLHVSVTVLDRLGFLALVGSQAAFSKALSECLMHLSMSSPRKGGTPGICGAFDFSEEILVKIPTVEPQKLVKSDQISMFHQFILKMSSEK